MWTFKIGLPGALFERPRDILTILLLVLGQRWRAEETASSRGSLFSNFTKQGVNIHFHGRKTRPYFSQMIEMNTTSKEQTDTWWASWWDILGGCLSFPEKYSLVAFEAFGNLFVLVPLVERWTLLISPKAVILILSCAYLSPGGPAQMQILVQ